MKELSAIGSQVTCEEKLCSLNPIIAMGGVRKGIQPESPMLYCFIQVLLLDVSKAFLGHFTGIALRRSAMLFLFL